MFVNNSNETRQTEQKYNDMIIERSIANDFKFF